MAKYEEYEGVLYTKKELSYMLNMSYQNYLYHRSKVDSVYELFKTKTPVYSSTMYKEKINKALYQGMKCKRLLEQGTLGEVDINVLINILGSAEY